MNDRPREPEAFKGGLTGKDNLLRGQPWGWKKTKHRSALSLLSQGNATCTDVTLQEAKAMCDTCPVDPKFWLPAYWKVTIDRI